MAETPLLANSTIPEAQKTSLQLVISQTFQGLANLSNLLPTFTILTFQLLLPVFSNMGECDDTSRCLTFGLLIFCALLCFLQSFTDSCIDEKGNVLYGFATFSSMWIIDGSTTLPPEVAAQHKLKFIDFMHAVMSVVVLVAIALFNQNVINCFFPDPSLRTEQLLAVLPVGIGATGSMFFVRFPTTRHGIGFPVTTTT